MSATRLLLISTSLAHGGAERFTSTLLQRIDLSRFNAQLVLLRDRIDYRIPESVEVHSLGYRSLLDLPHAIRRLRQLIEWIKPDVILSNVVAANVLTGLALPHNSNVRWLARVGSSPSGYDSWLRNVGAARVYPKADAVIANSLGLAREIRSRFPGLGDRILMIPNPCDFELCEQLAEAGLDEGLPSDFRIDPGHDCARLIAIGRLIPTKRYDLMINAFAQVCKRRSATLWICGAGVLKSKLVRQVNRLGLRDRVQFLGFVSNPYSLITRSDLFLMASDSEGSPNALIEAQGLGLAAVATDCPHGPNEIIEHRVSGLLSRPGDVNEFAACIEELLADSELRKQMGTMARQIARERFSTETQIKLWCELIDGVERGELLRDSRFKAPLAKVSIE